MRIHSADLLTLTGLLTLAFFNAGCRDSPTLKSNPVGTFNMGEKATVGPLIYTIFDSKWAISLGEQPTLRVPANRFYILNVTVVNSGIAPSSIPTFTLVDDSGQTYQELDNGDGVANWMGFVRRVRPAESAQGTIVFDVPQKRFQLRVSDEEDRFALVNIPLSLGDAPPSVTNPSGK
jgi:hypothetical protein